MSGLEQWIDPIFSESIASLRAKHDENLLSVVRYGSTTEFIKYETDVDLLLVFRKLPHRRERHTFVSDWEDLVNSRLMLLKSEGFQLQLSPMLRSLEEARRWSKIYLDMTDHSVIYFDAGNTFRRILAGMDSWIKQHAASKQLVNGMPVWKYPIVETEVDLLDRVRCVQ